MSFKTHFKEQLKLHPSMQPQDMVKLCYQAAHGAEHLLSDPESARIHLEREYAAVSAASNQLYEPISDLVCRIDLSAWKSEGLPVEWLFRMFSASSTTTLCGKDRFAEYLKAAGETASDAGFSMQAWEEYLREYKKAGMPAVHHSEPYRLCERPSYRIVNSRFCRLLPILQRINEPPTGESPCVIAIDGRAASGKTTLATDLQTVLDADIVHMDDFFLPSSLRTADRLTEPGGNIHYERFLEEVLPFLPERKPFSYRVFDCSRMDFGGLQEIGSKQFRIVEGSYSLHPKFGEYADLTVFSDVSPKEQIDRIRQRNGEEMLEAFRTRWIPMEERYFQRYSVKSNASITV